MKKYRVYICSLLFIALTAVKLLFPAHSAGLRERVRELVCRDENYLEMAEAMGRKISSGELREALRAALGLEDGARETGLESAGAAEERKQNALSTQQSEKPAQTTEPEEQPEAVSAFLEQQRKYAGCEIPENVRTDMPELPFEYACPVSGLGSSGFGFREHPIDGGIKFHYGTDFAAEEGAAVFAFAGGSVYAAGSNAGYGNYIILTHEGGFATVYAHLSEFAVGEGDTVRMGQQIGKAGHTGKATGPHLHFELLLNDVYLNPEYYI